MSISECTINVPTAEDLERVLFGEPDPPVLPAVRSRYHNGRRWKMETQGRADRRVRRQYRDMMAFHYRVTLTKHELEREFFEWTAAQSSVPSLYDFVMKL